MLPGPSHITLIATLALLAAGCGPPPGGAPGGEGPPLRPTPTASLELSVRDGEGGSAEATLRCSPGADRATGFLRLERAPDLCRRLGELVPTLTRPPPRDRVCAEVFGGPATARVEGRLQGRRVDRRLARTDACEISDWERLDVLLPDLG
jgi:hypothetical protein